MNADFQLRHATISRHGSFWGTQTDADTKGKLRELSRTSAIPSRLQHIDVGGAYALGSQKMIKEDVILEFKDGHFAVTGPDMQSYVAVETVPDTGVYEMLRDNAAQGVTGYVPRSQKLSTLTDADVVMMTADVPELKTPGSWFLIPKPTHVNPIILSTKKANVALVYGVDFFTSKYFIITQHSPAEYFETGTIVASLAEVYMEAFDSYPSDSPRVKKGRKWVNTFAKRAQSMEIFRRAAAEFCGLYVVANDDVVLNALKLPGNNFVYAFANAGVVIVDYEHVPITPGTFCRAGYVICDQFELRSQATHGSGFLTSTELPVDLTGIFGMPIHLPATGLVECSYDSTGLTNIPHLKLHYSGDLKYLNMMWAMQEAQERLTGRSLAAELGGGMDAVSTFPSGAAFPPIVDAAELLSGFYGNRLFLLVTSGIPAQLEFELARFLSEHTPSGAFVVRSDGGLTPPLPPLPPVSPSEGNVFYSESNLYYEVSPLFYN